MPHPKKYFVNKTAVFISTRTVEGLPFSAAPYMKTILESVFARALALYPVRIFAFIFMGNHLHLGLVVSDPELVPKFMKYIKGESAGAINRLLGRSARKVWEDGYDSPVILDSEKAIQQIVYIYANPAKSNLVEHIHQYPGFNSWMFFKDNTKPKGCPWIRRKRIPKLERREMTGPEQHAVDKLIRETSQVSFPLIVEPNCWMECFETTRDRNPDEVNDEIRERLAKREAELKKQRTQPVVGVKKLVDRRIDTPYLPATRGRRMWCLSCIPELRRDFVAKVKLLVAEGEETLRRWKSGDLLAPFPPGLFPPSLPIRAHPIRI